MQEKVDKYMLVNVNCTYSHRHAVISEPNIQRKKEKARILCTTTQGPSTP